MGCYSGKSSTKLNFIPARMANGVLTSDLGGDVETCFLSLSPPVLSGEIVLSSVVELSWVVASGGVSVDIYQSIDDISYSLIDTVDKDNGSVQVLDLIPETLYYFKAKYAGVGGVESVFSNVVDLTTPQLEAPSDLLLSDIQLDQITLNWINNSGGYEDETQIERSLTGVGGWSQINTVSPGVTTYVDDAPPLSNGTEYFYRVRTEKDAKLSDYSNIANATTPSLAAPSDLLLSGIQLEEITLNWASNSAGAEDGFEIERSLNGVDGWVLVNSVGTGITTYIDDTPPLEHNTEYFYRVRATDALGDSDYSNIENATTLQMAAPSALVASIPAAPSQIQLDWVSNSISEEDGFEIERSLDGVSGWSLIGSVLTNVVTFTDDSPLPSITYYYKVRAVDSLGNSPYSNIDSNQIINVAVSLGDDDLGDSDLGD